MIRIALDSNILIYAEVEPETEKGRRAAEIILLAAQNGVIPVQVFGEFLRFIQRRAPAAFASACAQVDVYSSLFVTPATSDEILSLAMEIAEAHGLQVWDAVICAAAERAGARVLVTEDLQDGRDLAGLRILNPFNPANDAAFAGLVAS
jgi:predicted nucleic acid-binding protein